MNTTSSRIESKQQNRVSTEVQQNNVNSNSLLSLESVLQAQRQNDQRDSNQSGFSNKNELLLNVSKQKFKFKDAESSNNLLDIISIEPTLQASQTCFSKEDNPKNQFQIQQLQNPFSIKLLTKQDNDLQDLFFESNSKEENYAFSIHLIDQNFNYPTQQTKQKGDLKRTSFQKKFRAKFGRKVVDEEMENKLLNWLEDNFPKGNCIKISTIRKKAIQFCSVDRFQASKGWAVRFIERYTLDQYYQIS